MNDEELENFDWWAPCPPMTEAEKDEKEADQRASMEYTQANLARDARWGIGR